MTDTYQEADWQIVDYEIYQLDSEVLDRQTGLPLGVRGPKENLSNGYFACVGAAQTFGRFCEKPFPLLLKARLGLPALNFGRGGAGPSFFSQENTKLLTYLNGARFVVLQVMSGRSESNSLFESKGIGHYTRRDDGRMIGCDEAFSEIIESENIAYVRQVVEETRKNWINSYITLLKAIRVPVILFWFSERKPRYWESYRNVYSLFGKFPQLVNLRMVKEVRRYSDFYVECVYAPNPNAPLIDRFSGKPIEVKDPWNGALWTNNWYYPSPQAHVKAANLLESACLKCLKKS
jgi:hypothetical protein